jgi:1-acyl-sn-glycerol-3-phosphate acyltransferase
MDNVFRRIYAVLWRPVSPIAQLICRFEVNGKEHLPSTGGCLLVSNHPVLAPLIIAVCLDGEAAFAVAVDAFPLPGYESLILALGHAPIDRRRHFRRGEIQKLVMIARAAIDIGSAFVIFPEGKRTFFGGELKKFKRGAALLAQQLGCVTIPVGISYSLRKWSLRPVVRISLGEAISCDGSSVDALTVKFEQEVARLSGLNLPP